MDYRFQAVGKPLKTVSRTYLFQEISFSAARLKEQGSNKVPHQAFFNKPWWHVGDVLFVQGWHICPMSSRFKVMSRVVSNVEPNHVHESDEVP